MSDKPYTLQEWQHHVVYSPLRVEATIKERDALRNSSTAHEARRK